MTVTFYKNSSDNNVLNKSITAAFTNPITGTLREKTSMLNPSILFEISPSLLKDVNYMYITEFERYYFIEDIIADSNGLTRVVGRVDVLMSYADSIKDSTAIVKRNALNYNLLINDGSLVAYADGYVLAYKFSGGFNTNQLVLITAG